MKKIVKINPNTLMITKDNNELKLPSLKYFLKTQPHSSYKKHLKQKYHKCLKVKQMRNIYKANTFFQQTKMTICFLE